MRVHGRKHAAIAALLALLTLAACRLPKDPEKTSDHVENGVMRVGVSENRPWTQVGTAEPSGPEADMVRALARQLNARIVWTPGGEGALLKDLKAHKLDLVIGGIAHDTPWKKTLAMTRKFGPGHVWLVPAGENSWLLTLDTYLKAHDPAKSQTVAP